MEKKVRKPINRKISFILAVSIAIIVIVAEIFTAVQLRDVMTEDSQYLLEQQAKSNSQWINAWFQMKENDLRNMVRGLESMSSTEPNYIMNFMEKTMAESDDVLMYYTAFGYNKKVYAADHTVPDLDPTERGWYKKTMEEQDLIYTEPYIDAVSGQVIISIAVPFIIKGKEAVALADITVDSLVKVVSDINDGKSISAFLIADDGSIVYHSNKSYLPSTEGNTKLLDVLNVDLNSNAVTTYTEYDGSLRHCFVNNIDVNNWKLGVTSDITYLNSNVQQTVNKNILVLVVMSVIAILILSFVLKKMLQPIRNLVNALAKVSEGDFNVKVKATKRVDEIGILQNSVAVLVDTLTGIIGDANRILGDIARYKLNSDDMKGYQGDFDKLSDSVNSIKNLLKELIEELQRTAYGVEDGADQLAQTADSMSQGSTTQANSIQKVAEDMNVMSNRILNNSNRCNSINEELSGLNDRIKKGNEEMDNLVGSVVDIEKMSSDIKKVTETIDNIAFQTNILALNASVEAARAGEEGKGFAVVADEVRSLAEKCGSESGKITELLDNCIAAITMAKGYADTTSECMNEVVRSSSMITDSFAKISVDTTAQAEYAVSVQDELQQISNVVQMNTAAAEETAAASEELSAQSVVLSNSVKRFEL